MKMDVIINRDALYALRELPSESVNCCVTSPPYYGLRDYGLDAQIGREDTPEQYIGRLVEVFRELRRVLKDDGTFWLNIADTYCGSGMKAGCKQKDLIGIPWLLAFALRSDGWYLRSDIIWLKENPMPESCRDRPSRCYEHTLTKFGKGDKTPDPYTPEQVKALMQRVEGTVWEMPVILGGLYGMRRSEILGLRWRNVDLENNTFDVTEQLPFKVPPKTKVIEEMAPPKSNGRKLPITELARPFFLKQLAMQEVQKEQAAKDGKPYYDNDLVVAKPDGAPIAASWVSSQFGKLLEDLDMPHIRFHDLRHTAATNMHQLTGDFYTVGEVLGHTLAGIGASLGLSMNFEAVTARYVDVRLERKKEVLDAYHSAVEKAAPEKPKEAEPKKGKRAAKKKHSEIDL